MSLSLIPFNDIFGNTHHDWLIHDPFRDEMFKGLTTFNGRDLSKQFSPLLTMDIVETGDDFKMMADLPGVDPKDLEITVEKNAIIMKAERKHKHETKTDKVHRLERSYGQVQRKFLLPKTADMDKAETHFHNGVLTVTVPKKVEDCGTTRKLTINTTKRIADTPSSNKKKKARS